ncbi:MAG: homoserine dehydrogenase [Lachnospiraceae bacterium]|nr:homoserine dehydrogenase [Lachnospiraceae bacterium]
MIKIAILGYGTIGSGVVEVLNTNRESIAKRAGDEIEVKYILDLRDFPGDPMEKKIVHDYDIIAKDPEIQVVVEAMGGVEPAYTFVKQALLAGKSVTTSNKALVAKHGAELIAIAREQSINFLFEASVGGGIPIIRPLNSSLTADEIEEITGILNGTTNYMLSKMTFEGLEFDDVLKDAQSRGYAEADPTADIEGHDACRKIAILTSLVCGQQVDFEEIYTEGITKITAADIRYAKAMGRVIKLLATSRKTEEGYCAMVAPFLLSQQHPLYSVNDVFNAIFVHGNVLGDAMFYGSGAGKLPTASAVAADLVEIAKHLHKNILISWSSGKMDLADYKKAQSRFFVRTSQGKEEVTKVFGTVEFIEPEGVTGETGFITEVMTEKDYEQKAAELKNILQRIRVV